MFLFCCVSTTDDYLFRSGLNVISLKFGRLVEGKDFVPKAEYISIMEARVGDIQSYRSPELVWLLEHPPLYTAGTGAAYTFPLYTSCNPVVLWASSNRQLVINYYLLRIYLGT